MGWRLVNQYCFYFTTESISTRLLKQFQMFQGIRGKRILDRNLGGAIRHHHQRPIHTNKAVFLIIDSRVILWGINFLQHILLARAANGESGKEDNASRRSHHDKGSTPCFSRERNTAPIREQGRSGDFHSLHRGCRAGCRRWDRI